MLKDKNRMAEIKRGWRRTADKQAIQDQRAACNACIVCGARPADQRPMANAGYPFDYRPVCATCVGANLRMMRLGVDADERALRLFR